VPRIAPESALACHALIEFVVGSAVIHSRAGATSETDVKRDHDEWRATYAHTPQQDFPTTAALARWPYPSHKEQFTFGLALLVESGRPPACPPALGRPDAWSWDSYWDGRRPRTTTCRGNRR